MAKSKDEMARVMIRGRIAAQPRLARTAAGTCVCRIAVERRIGPASRPVRMALYVKGAFALRCARGLAAGDLIEAWGDVGPLRRGVGHQELLVADGDLKLRERAAPSA